MASLNGLGIGFIRDFPYIDGTSAVCEHLSHFFVKKLEEKLTQAVGRNKNRTLKVVHGEIRALTLLI